eukprot:SAG31_NODE_930_length_10920_cov_4.478329_11_plen_848_part_00
MPHAVQLDELPEHPGSGEKLDFGRTAKREFYRAAEERNSGYSPAEMDAFVIESLSGLQRWYKTKKCVPGSRHAGPQGQRPLHSEGDPPRKLRHPNDVEGLFADKLGMAISAARKMEFGGILKQIYPVFAHVYSLGGSKTIRSLDKGLAYLSTGLFHAGCEVHGCEYSYGGEYNREGSTGVMRYSPKCCLMHEYLQTVYVGDTVYTPEEVAAFLKLIGYRKKNPSGTEPGQPDFLQYFQEDPLDPLFPGGAGGGGVPQEDDSPKTYFDREAKKEQPDLKYTRSDGKLGTGYPYEPDQPGLTAGCRKKETRDYMNETVEANRIGFMGREYDLLNNNCCWFTDYLIKILVRTTALDGVASSACCNSTSPGASIYIGCPKWVFSAARFGASTDKALTDFTAEAAKVRDSILTNANDANEYIFDTLDKVLQSNDISMDAAVRMSEKRGVKLPADMTPYESNTSNHEDGKQIDKVKWQDFLDQNTEYDLAKLKKYFEKHGLTLPENYIRWIMHCFDEDGDGKISGKKELDEVHSFVLLTSLKNRWLYYTGWLIANAAILFVGSLAVNAANNFAVDTSVQAAKGCNVDELDHVVVSIRLLGTLAITETILFYLIPVCGSCCPVDYALPKDERQVAKERKRRRETDKEQKIPLTARTGSIMFLKGVGSVNAVAEGCGNDFGFVFYFLETILICLEVGWLLSYVYACVVTFITRECTVAPNNRALWTTAMHVIIALFFFPMWNIFNRMLYSFVARHCTGQKAVQTHKELMGAKNGPTDVIVATVPVDGVDENGRPGKLGGGAATSSTGLLALPATNQYGSVDQQQATNSLAGSTVTAVPKAKSGGPGCCATDSRVK